VGAYFLWRLAVLATAVAVVMAAAALVALVLPGKQGTLSFIATAVVGAVTLRVWSAARPRSRRVGAIRSAAGREWDSREEWATTRPIRAAVVDGLTVFVPCALWSVVFEEPSDLTMPSAAACGGMVCAFGVAARLIDRRRNRRRSADAEASARSA